jgi:hypothetical protein
LVSGQRGKRGEASERSTSHPPVRPRLFPGPVTCSDNFTHCSSHCNRLMSPKKRLESARYHIFPSR